MIALLIVLACAQEPTSQFEPFVLDAVHQERLHIGFMVDEATMLELGTLRIETRVLTLELTAFEDWKTRRQTEFEGELLLIQSVHEDGVEAVQTYYTGLLKNQRPSFFEKTAFVWGVVIGAAVVVGIGVAVISSYGLAAKLTF